MKYTEEILVENFIFCAEVDDNLKCVVPCFFPLLILTMLLLICY